MMTVYHKMVDTLDRIKNARGNKKLDILKAEIKDDALLRQALEFVFDARIVTGISKKKLNKKVEEEPIKKLSGQMAIIEYLLYHNTGTDQDIAEVQYCIEQARIVLGDSIANHIESIVLKEIKIGMTGLSINKVSREVLGYNLCYYFHPYKGKSLDEKGRKKMEGKTIIITPKIDGYRKTYVYGDLHSPEGRIDNDYLEILDELQMFEQAAKYAGYDGLCLDGEFLANTTEKMSTIERYGVTSSICGSDGYKEGVDYLLFDCFTISDWENGKSKLGAFERKRILKTILSMANFKRLKYVEPLYIGEDLSMIDTLFDKSVENGEEGIMVQTADSKYEPKRVSDGIWKVKGNKEADLKVISFEKGEQGNEFENTLGKIFVEYKGQKCGVGTGFKTLKSEKYPENMTRDYIWENQNELLGKIARIKFMEYKDKNGKPNIRHGSFRGWTEKKEESLN